MWLLLDYGIVCWAVELYIMTIASVAVVIALLGSSNLLVACRSAALRRAIRSCV